MAYMDEIEVGDRVTVTDLRTGKRHDGTVEALVMRRALEHTDGYSSKVHVRYDSGRVVSVSPEFVTLHVGEAT